MDDSILKKRGANFYGFERIDSLGKHHYQIATIRGSGDLLLTKNGVLTIIVKDSPTNLRKFPYIRTFVYLCI